MSDLNQGELAILPGLAAGLTNIEIGNAHHISEDTVKSRVRRILAKLDARNRAHIVGIAYQHGLLRTDATSAVATTAATEAGAAERERLARALDGLAKQLRTS